jgi:hypothetical protein
MTWATAGSGSLSKRTWPGQVGGHGHDDVDAAVGQGCIGGRGVRIGRHGHRAIEPLGGRLDGGREGCRRRLDEADLGDLLATEQDGRDDERADHDDRRERDAEHEPAAPSSFEDLSPGHQPDASPAWHHATSRGSASGATACINSSDSFGGW